LVTTTTVMITTKCHRSWQPILKANVDDQATLILGNNYTRNTDDTRVFQKSYE